MTKLPKAMLPLRGWRRRLAAMSTLATAVLVALLLATGSTHASPNTASKGFQIQAATATDIDADGYHACAVMSDGTLSCWGSNAWGQLGDGTTTSRSIPVAVSGISTATQVSGGFGHTCARLSDGTVKCWGRNCGGQLGNGTTTDSSTPVAVSGFTTATQVSAGSEHTCARLADVPTDVMNG